ncbi:hypothetical protein C2845_PM13G23560 [Panicum miliaceum]|uniref:DUF4283 domain-containing protein n=1 Tax=Panicum miliaceum TaxID=4540 RepID=A0A3L6RJ51_PANMI|nr:hypothetical protein C2845_PM13G23560 [Panicum miliaceum]
MEYVPGRPHQRPVRSRAVVVATREDVRETANLLARAVVLTMPHDGFLPCALDVAHALNQQLRIPAQNIRVTRHKPEGFFAYFDLPQQRDHALRVGQIEIGGTVLSIHSWREGLHQRPRTWWYRAKISIEHLPENFWSVGAAQQALGECCIVERLESRTHAREVSDVFTCWAWMWNPDMLPRTIDCSLFPAGAGKVLVDHDRSLLSSGMATPPEGSIPRRRLALAGARFR